MRILSQKGLHTVDLNYDLVGVSVSFIDPCEIIAYSIMEHNDKCWTMAKYSTPEKAEKALEMLHNEYHEYKYGGTYCDGKEYYHPIFQFPADEEITAEESDGEKTMEKMKILVRDNGSGEVREYGTNQHDALRISDDGGYLTYENLQCGDGSLVDGKGGFSFVLEDGKTPNESRLPDAECGMTYANIGGFNREIKTNSDMIRSMSDGELADFLILSPEMEFEVCQYCKYGNTNSDERGQCLAKEGKCYAGQRAKAFYKWLQSEVESEEKENE